MSYPLKISAFDSNGRHTAGAVTTTGTSVTVPPGLLATGTSYAITLTADSSAPDPKAPFRATSTYANADAPTALFTP